MNPLLYYQIVAVLLLGLGLYALVARRTLIGMLIGVELMLNGAGLSIVAAAQLTPMDAVFGQLGALLVMGLAAAEATLVLAIVLVVSKRFGDATADAPPRTEGVVHGRRRPDHRKRPGACAPGHHLPGPLCPVVFPQGPEPPRRRLLRGRRPGLPVGPDPGAGRPWRRPSGPAIW